MTRSGSFWDRWDGWEACDGEKEGGEVTEQLSAGAYLAKACGEAPCEKGVEDDDGLIQVPHKHALRSTSKQSPVSERLSHFLRTAVVNVTSRFDGWVWCVCVCVEEEGGCVVTSISESRGGVGSLALFLPLSFPSELRLAGTSSFPGVGGLGGSWYSPGTHTHTHTDVNLRVWDGKDLDEKGE